MTYSFCTNIEDADFGITLAYDFECEVEVETSINAGELEITVTDVLVEGKSLFKAGDISKRIGAYVIEAAQSEIDDGGWLFDQVHEREGLSLSGHPNDPDTRWLQAAE